MAMPKLMILSSRLLVTVIVTLLASTCQGEDVLLSGEKLYAGQSLDEGSYSLVLRDMACTLLLFDGRTAIWGSTVAFGRHGCFAVMQTDGNFVIYEPNAAAVVWASNTCQQNPHPLRYALVLQQDRNLVIYGPLVWDAGTDRRRHTVTNGSSTLVGAISSTQDAIAATKERNVLLSGQKLEVGQSLDEGCYSLRMQDTCNLALVDCGKVVWSSNIASSNRKCTANMQNDGNLVIYTSTDTPVWATNTRRKQGNFILVLQRDGNIAIYGPALWSTDTNLRSVGGVVAHAMVNGTAGAGFIQSQNDKAAAAL